MSGAEPSFDGPAVQQLGDLLSATAGGDALREMCILAMRRHRLIAFVADRGQSFPAAIPVAWARLGDWSRAEHVAPLILHSMEAYTGLAEVAAGNGDVPRFRRLVDAARDPARPSTSDWFRARHLAVLGRSAARLGATGLARDLLREAETVLRRTSVAPDADHRGEAMAAVAQAYAAIGARRHARQLIAEAERQLDGLRPADLRAYRLSLIAFASAEVRGADAAQRSFPDPRDPAYTVRVVAAFARAAAGAGDRTRAGRLLDAAARSLPSLDHGTVVHGQQELRLRETLIALTELAEAAARVGDPQRALGCLQRAGPTIRLLGYDSSQHQLHARLALVYELLGDHASACGRIARITDPDIRLAALIEMARAATESGDEQRAGALLDRAAAVARSVPGPRQIEPRRDLAVALAEAGRPERAEEILRSMYHPRQPFWEILALAEAVAEVGRLDQAQPLLALAGGDEDLRVRMLPPLAEAAGRTDRLSLVDELAEGVEAAGLLRKAAVGAAGAGRFDTAMALLTRAGELRELSPPSVVEWRGLQHTATRIAVLALRAGSPLLDDFCTLVRPSEAEDWPADPLIDAIRGDIEPAVQRVTAGTGPVADAATALAIVASARGDADLAGSLLDFATRAALGWSGAVRRAIDGELSLLAVTAAELGQTDRADALLERLTDAHPDHRVPALAARAVAHARAGEPGRARAVMDEAFACLLSREGGAGGNLSLAACVRAGVEVDPRRCRTQLAHALATQQDTPRFLAAVPLADPSLAGLAVSLLAGADPPAAPGGPDGGS